MPPRLRTLLALLAFLTVPVAVAHAAVRKPRASVGTTLTVQVGLGVLKPGPNFSERRVRALLGKPDKVGFLVTTAAGRKPSSLSYERKYGLVVFFDINRTGAPLEAVVARAPQFRTAEGVRVGGTLSQLRRAYPDLPMPCGRGPGRDRICSINEPQGQDLGATIEQTQFIVRGTRIREISVSSSTR